MTQDMRRIQLAIQKPRNIGSETDIYVVFDSEGSEANESGFPDVRGISAEAMSGEDFKYLKHGVDDNVIETGKYASTKDPDMVGHGDWEKFVTMLSMANAEVGECDGQKTIYELRVESYVLLNQALCAKNMARKVA